MPSHKGPYEKPPPVQGEAAKLPEGPLEKTIPQVATPPAPLHKGAFLTIIMRDAPEVLCTPHKGPYEKPPPVQGEAAKLPEGPLEKTIPQVATPPAPLHKGAFLTIIMRDAPEVLCTPHKGHMKSLPLCKGR